MGYKFQFNINDNLQFEGDIICQRCIEINKKGNQCNKKTCIGTPYCWIHLLYNYKLKVKDSTIPNAGKGLFVIDKKAGDNDIIFRKNDKIITYGGELINRDELEDRYDEYTAPYGYQIDSNNFRDGALKRGVGTLGNNNAGRNNAKIVANKRNKTASIKATNNIRNGSEIFISYGRDYRFDEPTSFRTYYKR